MPDFEYELSSQDRELVLSEQMSEFNGTNYIRLTIYPSDSPNNIVSLPNEDNKLAIFYASLNPTRVNTSPFNVGTDVFSSRIIGDDNFNDFKIYQTLDEDGNVVENSSIYIKPNEIFNEFGLPQGNFKIQIDFLNQLKEIPEDTSTTDSIYQFIIKQISTSRKEVRLKLLDRPITNNSNEP